MGSHPMRGRIFFLVSFFPTAYCYDTAYYIILHYFLHTSDCNRYFGQHETLCSKQNVLHQIIQLFILLNACVLFTDMLNNYISTAHYLFLHYLQCVFVNFCYRFHFFQFVSFHFISFFVHRCFHIVFQRCFLSTFLKIYSKVFSQGF